MVEDLGAHAQRVGEGLGADRLDHEFLDVDIIVGVLAAIDDVHHRHRHRILAGGAIQVGDVRIQRYALGLCSCLGGCQGHGEDGIGAQLGLVLGTVQLDHRLVQRLLVDRVLAQQQVTDRTVDVGYGVQHALAQVTTLVAVAQLERLARTRGGAGRCTSTANNAVVQDHVGFHCRVAAGIEHLTSLDIDDLCHCY